MSDIRIIYGSTSGNTELVCEFVCHVLTGNGHEVILQRVEHARLEDLDGHDLVILAASTYGHGILQDHFIPFAERLEQQDLSGKRFAVIGLGDDKYDAEYNVESAVILEDLVSTRGGELITGALMINKPPVPQLQTKVHAWAEGLAAQLLQTER